MSDILTVLNNSTTFDLDQMKELFQSGSIQTISPPAPPHIQIKNVGLRITMGYNRIQSRKKEDPSIPPPTGIIKYKNMVLICDGDIYNYKELYEHMNIIPTTNHSYEVIVYLYERYGIEQTLQTIDGEFSFMLLDNNIHEDHFKLFIARDPYGKKPLYLLNYINRPAMDDREDNIICFSTNKRILNEFYNNMKKRSILNNRIRKSLTSYTQIDPYLHNLYQIKTFLPGTCTSYYMDSKMFASWKIKKENIRYHTTGFNSLMYNSSIQYSDAVIIQNIQMYLIRSIEKRCCLLREPILCLLDGSIVSSILAGLLQQYSTIHHGIYIETFSVGTENSIEMLKSRKVAEYIGTRHKEIIIKKDDKKDVKQKFAEELRKDTAQILQETPLTEDGSEWNKTVSFEIMMESNHSADSILSKKSDMNNDSIPSDPIEDTMTNPVDMTETRKELLSLLRKVDDHHISNETLCNQYLLGKYIRKICPNTTLFIGSGGEPLFGGNKEIEEIKECIEYDYQVRKSLQNMYLDLITNQISMRYNGLESSTPFLDTSFINYYLSIPPSIRFDSERSMNKFFLRLAFSKEYYKNTEGNPFLPDDIIWTY